MCYVKEREGDRKADTRVNTPREKKTERGQDGGERSEAIFEFLVKNP